MAKDNGRTTPGGSHAKPEEDVALPPGWKKRESKSQKGKYYFISPSGKTQWAPPSVKRKKSNQTFSWVHSVEIEFSEKRLGVSLREVKQSQETPYPLFQAEVDDLPKVGGKPGPAELHNWSVKPHQRLTVGMRLVSLDGVQLAGDSYAMVVEKIKSASRPLKIVFANASRGTYEDNPDAVPPEEGDFQSSDFNSHSSLRFDPATKAKRDLVTVLVSDDLRSELWKMEMRKLLRQIGQRQQKYAVVSKAYNRLNKDRLDLRKENDRLLVEKRQFEHTIQQLKEQEKEGDNPELKRADELGKRNTELKDDISKMTSGNKSLQKKQEGLEKQLQELQAQVDEKMASAEEDRNADDEFFALDPKMTPKKQLHAMKRRRRFMEDELAKEQKRTSRVLKEMEQLNKHLSNMDKGTDGKAEEEEENKSESVEEKKEGKADKPEQSAKKEKPKTKTEELEAKIQELRQRQRKVVETLSKAAQNGDQALAQDCQKKRHAIKEELRNAQDELNNLKGGKVSSSSRPAPKKEKPSSQPSPSSSAVEASPKRPQMASPKMRKMSSVNEADDLNVDRMPTLTGFLEKGPTEWSSKNLIGNMKKMRGARERWCEVTSDGYLRYYKRRGDAEIRGEIELNDPSLEVVCPDERRGTEFILSTSTQQSHFFTKNPQELARWVKTLRSAHRYLMQQRKKKAGTKTTEALKRNTSGPKEQEQGAWKSKVEFTMDSGEVDDFDVPEDESMYGRATLGF